MSNAVTIKDLARILGVSVSTVSRALKDHPEISLETRNNVQELAKKMHYKPNAIALSLRQRKTKLIGVVIPEIIHHFFSCVISGVERVAHENGYNVVIFQSNEDYEREVAICQSIINSHIDGLLISMSKNTSQIDHFRELREQGIPIVFFDRICGELNTDRVVVDDFQGALIAVRHLISVGCKRIAHLAAPQKLLIGQKRQLGYLEALKEAHLPIDKKLIIPCDNQYDAIDVIRRLMALPNPPDGIFAVNDLTAAGAIHELHKLNYRIPEDIAVCGFTDGMVATLTTPTLTTVEQHGAEIGEQAAQLLIRRIEEDSESLPPVTKVIKTNLIVRESTVGVLE